MARNIATQRGEEIRYFTTANFDLIQFDDFRDEGKPYEAHYYHRPKKTILVRTVKDGGESFHIQGDFDRTVPNLYLQVVTKLFFKKEKSPLLITPCVQINFGYDTLPLSNCQIKKMSNE
jgi:hypothetical protein